MAKRKKASTVLVPAAPNPSSVTVRDTLLDDVRNLIRQAREATAQAVNSALVLLYWQIGQRIRTEVLKEKRAGYGEEIVAALSRQLITEFGRGFAEKSIRRMIQFAEVFHDEQIVSTLSRQLGWSHFVEIMPLNASQRPQKRQQIRQLLLG